MYLHSTSSLLVSSDFQIAQNLLSFEVLCATPYTMYFLNYYTKTKIACRALIGRNKMRLDV